MNCRDDALYRLSLAVEFHDATEREHSRGEWALCVQQAQLCVENAAKAVLATVGPTPKTHEPRDELQSLLDRLRTLPPNIIAALNALLASCERLGAREHVLSSYGDEQARRTPSQIFDQAAATTALGWARDAVSNAQQLVDYFAPPPPAR